MKTFKMEYLLLPMDNSHIQDFMFRSTNKGMDLEWDMGRMLTTNIIHNGKKTTLIEFAKSHPDFELVQYEKVELHECKIVRKNVRRKKV